jgi:Mn2+/Fe2+ NRAMP family transporter
VLLLGTIFFNYDWLRNIFMGLGLLLLAYVVSAFLARPDWGAALHATVIPTLPTTLPAAAAAVALLGTTVSPYLIVWQAEGEREAHRSRRQFQLAVLDVTVGYVASNLVSYFIIVTTAATLFVQHRSIATAADAAAALRPVAGDLASTIFAIGLLGAAVLAIPMFPISIGYTIGGALNWPCGLSAPFHEARGFYVIVALAFLSGGAAAFLGIDPILALFYSQILNGLSMPFMIVILFLLTNDRRVMGDDRNGRYYNVWLVLSALIMAVAAVWLVAGLV